MTTPTPPSAKKALPECNSLPLQKQWNEMLRLFAEGAKLHAESDKLRTKEFAKFHADGDKLHPHELADLYHESDKLHAAGSKLYVEGDNIFLSAIIEKYGNCKREWKNWNTKYRSYECHLENGDVYGFPD